MATTFDLFYLGIAPEIDTVEGNYTSENHDALNGLSFGGDSDPLYQNVQTLSPDPVQGPGSDGDATTYNANNYQANERFLIDGGAPQTFDALMVYANTVVTYTDGTTATIEAIVMQDTAGRLYLVPSASGPNADTDALEAKPIESITLGTAQPSNGTEVYHMIADRYELALNDGVIEGTGGGDLIDASYTGDPDGDRVDNTDNFEGNDDDLIYAGAGNDTVYYGEGNNTVYGGDGNDLIDDISGTQLTGDDYLDGGAGDDTIYGGGGTDTILGSEGNDLLLGEDGGDAVYGGSGNDTIHGGDGDDLIFGDTAASADAVLVAFEDFESGASGWSDNTTESGGQFGEFLGRFAGTSGDSSGGPLTEKTFDLANGFSSVVVEFDLYIIDSWDGDNPTFSFGPEGDAFQLYVDGQQVANEQFSWNDPSFDGDRTGTITIDGVDYTYSFVQTESGDLGFASEWDDQIWRVRLEAENYTADQITIGFGSTTNLSIDDESLGIDNLSVVSTNDTSIDVKDAGGNDLLFGDAGNDTISGGAGDDRIEGGTGDDLMQGGNDADFFVLQDGHGNDTIEGGEGGDDWDEIDASAVTGDSTLTFTGHEAGTLTAGTDSATFTEIEWVQLGSGNDTVDASVTTGGVMVDAGDGDDLITGGAGDDLLAGSGGADTLVGGAGDDYLLGGAGDDSFVFADGHGTNIVSDFDMGDADENGFTNDQLDVSDLLNGAGNPVKTNDVSVSDDGSGNAVLTFPDGTSVILLGVDPNTLDAGTLYSMGVPCFAVGTRIATPGGPRAVESLKPGDLVSIFGGGALPVVWAARSDLDAETLAQQPGLRPVRIRAGALGNARDLLLSPQHRVALGASQRPEGFVPARWLAEDGDGRFRVARGKRAVSYVRLMLARHAVVLAEGAPVESFYPGPQALAALDVFARAGLFLRFPALSAIRSRADARARYGPLALPELDRREMLALIPAPGAAPSCTTAPARQVRSATGA